MVFNQIFTNNIVFDQSDKLFEHLTVFQDYYFSLFVKSRPTSL